MRRKFMATKKAKQAIVILTSLLLCAILILGVAINLVSLNAFTAEASSYNGFGDTDESMVTTFAADASNYNKVLYLSDESNPGIKHDASKSKADRNKLFFNHNDAGAAIQVKIENAWYTFPNGIYAHGPSYVAFNISAFSQEYKYFSAYAGLLPSATKSDGALFYVQTSEDGANWSPSPPTKTLIKYNQEAAYFTMDVTGANWIRLVADKNGSNAQDYVVWADAKLSTTLDS